MTILLAVILFLVISFAFAVAFGRAARVNDLPDGLAYAPPVLPEAETETEADPEPVADGDAPPLTVVRVERRQYRSRLNKRHTTGGWGGAVAK